MNSFPQLLQFYVTHPIGITGLVLALVMYQYLVRDRVQRTKLPIGLFIVYLVLQLAWKFAEYVPWMHAGELGFNVLSAIVLAWAICRLFFSVLFSYIARFRGTEAIPKITQDILIVLSYTSIALIVLRVLGGVNLTGLLTTSAVLTAIIGLAAQNTLSSLFAGVILQIERPFRIGDWITAGQNTGKVIGITWKSTQLLTRNEEMIVIPNVEIATTTFCNYSRPSPTHISHFTIGISYTTPPNAVRRVILEVLAQHPAVLPAPPAEVRLIAFGDFAITYDIRFANNRFPDEPLIIAEINNQLWYALRRNHIRIPVPTRDIRIAHHERPHEAARLAELAGELRAVAAAVPMLAPLSSEQREQVVHSATLENYGSGEIIVRQGDPGDSLFIVKRGNCAVSVRHNDGHEQQLATFGRGDFFGEMSLLTGAPRSATVRATDDVSVMVIGKEVVRELLAAQPAIATTFADTLTLRMRQQQDAKNERALVEPVVTGRMLDRIKAFFGMV